jgi:peptidoglycan/LPS O-acetylase OafA/YrhL
LSAATATHSSEDLKALTSLRFFAALMIFLFHLRDFDRAPWISWIPGSMRHGVSFFFVLSGFILTHAYLAQRPFPYRRFLMARFARLYPTVLASTFLLLLLLPLNVACGQFVSPQIASLAFLAKVSMLESLIPIRGVQFAWNSVSWSISTEFFFYAAFPLLLLNLERSWAVKLLASAAAALALFSLGLWLQLPVADGDRTTVTLMQLAYANPLARGFEFVLGMATYLGWRRWIAPLKGSAPIWTFIEIALLAALALWLEFAAPALERNLPGPAWAWFYMSGSCWAFAILIPAFASARGKIGQALLLRPSVWLGEISFSFYMFHLIVMRAASFYVGDAAPALLIFALSLNLAAVNHRWIEIPARRLLRGDVSRTPAQTSPLAPAHP